MPEYVDLLPDDHSPAAIEADIIASIQSRWPEWEPAEGNLETWIIRGTALRVSELYDLAIDVSDEIFQRLGTLLGRPRHPAQPATATSTWTMIDDAGYTIPTGTLVAIPRSGSESLAFATATELTIPAGSTSGEVGLIAEDAGAEGSGLDATPQLIDALIFVDSIVLNDPTAGGADEEPIAAYLDRLRELLQLLTPRPILPADFEVLARQEVGVFRALAIDGLDPSDGSTGNERMIAVAVMDDTGSALPDGTAPATEGTKLYVEEQLDAQREVNFVVNVIDPSFNLVDVSTTVVSLPGYTHANVVSQVEAALSDYLDPVNWGRRSGREWRNQPTVRYLEVAEVVNGVRGVDYIDSLQINLDGGTPGTSDLTLTGDAPVTQAGVITVT